ncbi:MAG: hypothetical protein OXT68_04240 [Chloroflexota bacterium]|nr:hypothetical protein [Chloroflexota bacterium]
MDIPGLLRELNTAGISDVLLLVVIPLILRYWIIQSRIEQRKELRDALDDNNKEIYRYIDAKFEAVDARFAAHDARFDQIEARLIAHDAKFDQLDRKNDSRAYDMTLHLIDIRERLANIEGRMGIYPPRRGVEPPVPEPAAEPESGESAQS